MPLYLLYPIYTAGIFLIMLAVVPRERIRRLVPYALLYGAVGDFAWLLILGYLGIAGYINYGPFGFLGMPFFPLLAWTFFFIIYLHLLPERYPWNYLFTLSAAAYSLIFSNVLQNLGVFVWRTGRLVAPAVVYLTWMILVTYTYQNLFTRTRVRP